VSTPQSGVGVYECGTGGDDPVVEISAHGVGLPWQGCTPAGAEPALRNVVLALRRRGVHNVAALREHSWRPAALSASSASPQLASKND